MGVEGSWGEERPPVPTRMCHKIKTKYEWKEYKQYSSMESMLGVGVMRASVLAVKSPLLHVKAS